MQLFPRLHAAYPLPGIALNGRLRRRDYRHPHHAGRPVPAGGAGSGYHHGRAGGAAQGGEHRHRGAGRGVDAAGRRLRRPDQHREAARRGRGGTRRGDAHRRDHRRAAGGLPRPVVRVAGGRGRDRRTGDRGDRGAIGSADHQRRRGARDRRADGRAGARQLHAPGRLHDHVGEPYGAAGASLLTVGTRRVGDWRKLGGHDRLDGRGRRGGRQAARFPDRHRRLIRLHLRPASPACRFSAVFRHDGRRSRRSRVEAVAIGTLHGGLARRSCARCGEHGCAHRTVH